MVTNGLRHFLLKQKIMFLYSRVKRTRTKFVLVRTFHKKLSKVFEVQYS